MFSEPQRLHKVLASCGFGSRRAMEEMILAGRITVNRLPAEVGQKVGPGDEVRINGELVKVRFSEPRARVLMYHKPTGELVTRDDPEGRPTVFEKLPSIGSGKWINIGRLDYNTEGLLLFTNSGELANRMMHPRFEVEREYAVRVMGRLTDEQVQKLTSGIQLEDGPAKVDSVEDAGGDEDGANHWYKVVLHEGRNREVRRLFEALGLMVSRLIRTRYGVVNMPTVLKRGDILELEPAEVARVLDVAGLGKERPGNPARREGGRRNRDAGRPGGSPRQGGGKLAAAGAPGNGPPRGPAHGHPGGKGKGGFAKPFAKGGKGAGKGKGGKWPRPNGGGQPRTDYDERQPLSNANASPFGHTTLTVPGGMPLGRPEGEGMGIQGKDGQGRRGGHPKGRKGSGAPHGQGQGARRGAGAGGRKSKQARGPGQGGPRGPGQGGPRRGVAPGSRMRTTAHGSERLYERGTAELRTEDKPPRRMPVVAHKRHRVIPHGAIPGSVPAPPPDGARRDEES